MGRNRKYSIAGPIALSPTLLSPPPSLVLWCPVPCASLFWLIVVFTPPSCLLLLPSQARPFVAICPGHRRLSPSLRVATYCCTIAVAIASNSKLPLVLPGWLLHGISSHHHLLMHRRLSMHQLVVVLPIIAPTLPLTVVLTCCHLDRQVWYSWLEDLL